MRLLLKVKFANKSKPTVVVAPVGPISAVVAFLAKAAGLFSDDVRQFALLDKDAYDEYVVPMRKANKHTELAKVDAVKNKLNFLPWTPEVGICALFKSDIDLHEKAIREFFEDGRISFSQIDFLSIGSLEKAPQRVKSKKLVDQLCNEISGLKLRSEDWPCQELAEYFASAWMSGDGSAVMKQLLMPILELPIRSGRLHRVSSRAAAMWPS